MLWAYATYNLQYSLQAQKPTFKLTMEHTHLNSIIKN